MLFNFTFNPKWVLLSQTLRKEKKEHLSYCFKNVREKRVHSLPISEQNKEKKKHNIQGLEENSAKKPLANRKTSQGATSRYLRLVTAVMRCFWSSTLQRIWKRATESSTVFRSGLVITHITWALVELCLPWENPTVPRCCSRHQRGKKQWRGPGSALWKKPLNRREREFMSVLTGSKNNEGACQWPSGAMNSQESCEEITVY